MGWENGEMRFYDPLAGAYRLTFDETDDARCDAEERIRQLEAENRRLRNPQP